LAAKLGAKRLAIFRPELGEHNPSIEPLEQLAGALSLRLIVDVVPPGRTATVLPSDVRIVG
jgi:transcriptional regulator with XRE-family HTH domain